jgi:hypothetical protein
MNRFRALWLSGLLLVGWTWLASAAGPRPLPPFEVTELRGGTTVSAQLVPAPQWVILYIRRECGPCEAALQIVKAREDHPNLHQRLVIIGGMTLPELQAVAAKYPDLTGVHWVADPTGTAFHALTLKGAPVALGVRGQSVAWTVNGMLGDPQQFRRILESWTN